MKLIVEVPDADVAAIERALAEQMDDSVGARREWWDFMDSIHDAFTGSGFFGEPVRRGLIMQAW